MFCVLTQLSLHDDDDNAKFRHANTIYIKCEFDDMKRERSFLLLYDGGVFVCL